MYFENMKAGALKDLGDYQPGPYLDVKDALEELAEVMQAIGSGFDDLAKRLGPELQPYVAAFGVVMGGLSTNTDNVAAGLHSSLEVLETAHALEIGRINNPRPGEENLDVSTNLNRGR